MADLDDEWKEAMNEEYGDDGAVEEEVEDADDGGDTPEADEADKGDEESGDTPAADDTDTEDKPDGEEGESEESSEAEALEPAAEEAPEKRDTRDEIKAALREVELEKKGRESGLDTLKDEVLEGLYPEGIDRTLRDADGDPINGLQDLTGFDPQTGKQVGSGLVNPLTGEVFTEDEAGRYIMRGQQQLNEQVQKMEDQAYQMAEVQLNLKESSDRVEKEFGPILDKLPAEMTKRIADAYIATLRKDHKSGLVMEAPLDAYEFYQIALGPMRDLATAPPAPAPKPAPKPAPADKDDRADLGRRGTPEKQTTDDKEWNDAFDEILG